MISARTILNGLAIVVLLAGTACTDLRHLHADGGTGGAAGSDGPLKDSASDTDTGGDHGSGGTDGGMSETVVVVPPNSADVGQPCTGDGECASGFCRDDVCCAVRCEGMCQACSSTYTNLDNGLCGPVMAGQDPRGVCKDED